MQRDMTKLPHTGYFNPLYMIAWGILFVLLGIYGISLNGMSLGIVLLTLFGAFSLVYGIYVAFHYDDD